MRAIKKRLVKYKRKDGLDLSFTIYTPPGYKEGTRVPAILYAYPLDYADAKTAGEVSGSQQTFTRITNYRLRLAWPRIALEWEGWLQSLLGQPVVLRAAS